METLPEDSRQMTPRLEDLIAEVEAEKENNLVSRAFYSAEEFIDDLNK